MDNAFSFDGRRRFEYGKEDQRMLRAPERAATLGATPLGAPYHMPQHNMYPHQPAWDGPAHPMHDPYAPKAAMQRRMNPVPAAYPGAAPEYGYPRYLVDGNHPYIPKPPPAHAHEALDDGYYPPHQVYPAMGPNAVPARFPGQPLPHQQRFTMSGTHMQHAHQEPYHPSGRHAAAVQPNPGTGGSNAQGRAINKHLLDILRERVIDAQRLDLLIDSYVERMDCVNLATLLFHTGKKRLVLMPAYVKRIADRFLSLKEELRAREASNALYGLKCLSSEVPEVRELVHALAVKVYASTTDFVAQAVGNALYGCQMLSSEYEEVRYLLIALSNKVNRCSELLEAQNVGNALYGMRGMSSDHKEVRIMITALTPKIASAREELNGQALGNSLYGLQSMSAKEPEVRTLLQVLSAKVSRTWEDLKAQEVGNAIYGLKRMSTDISEVRQLIAALVPKIAQSPDVLDAQAVGNSLYGLQNMRSDNPDVLSLLGVLAEKISVSCAELDGQAIGNSLYGLQGMSSEYPEVRAVLAALTVKIIASCLEMNAQELGNALYGLHNMSSSHRDVRKIVVALAHKVSSSKHDLTSQEIGNCMFGLQHMSSEYSETRTMIHHLSNKIAQSHAVLDPQGVSNSLFGLQKLSSECAEVRHLVHTLAYKVEHCWKPLGANHIANACYGLQTLSSEDKEVRVMLQALLPKILSCREEMSAKQLCHCLFGLQRMSSKHVELLAIVTALTEKISLSNDTWTSQYLALAFFGMQGLSSLLEEVSLLLSVLNLKIMVMPLADIDPVMLGNIFYGMQRFESGNAEVCKLLSYLLTPLSSLIQYKVKVSPKVCANMIFGLNGMSCEKEVVRKVLEVLATIIGDIVDTGLNFSNMRHEAIMELYLDLLNLYQAFTLTYHAMPNLVSYPELRDLLNERLSRLQSMVEQNSRLYQPKPLNLAETHAVQEISRMLNKEPVVIRSSTLVYGLEVPILIQLSPNLDLKFMNGSNFNPVLGLDIAGSSYTSPARELFQTLRCSYLERIKGIYLRQISAESFKASGQSNLWKHLQAFSPLLPPNSDEGSYLNSQLAMRGQASTNYMTSITNIDEGLRHQHNSPSNTPFSSNTSSYIGGSQASAANIRHGASEYFDDDLLRSVSDNISNEIMHVRYHRRPFGLLVGWVGEWPRVTPSSLHTQSVPNPLTSQFSKFPTHLPGNSISVNDLSTKSQLDAQSRILPLSSKDYSLEKGFHLQSSSADYRLGQSSDSTFLEGANSLPLAYRDDHESDNSTGSGRPQAFSQSQQGMPLNSESSVSHLLSRSYSAFPSVNPHNATVSSLNSVLRLETGSTVRYDTSADFLAPDFSTSASFHHPSDSFIMPLSNFSKVVGLGDIPRQSNQSNQDNSVSDVSAGEEDQSASITQTDDLPSPNANLLGYTERNSFAVEESTGDLTGKTAEDEEVALLQAQLEMAKLEEKIKTLQNKKSQKTPILSKSAADALLASSSLDSI